MTKSKATVAEPYTVIHGWMVDELGLAGNDLLIYAVIYGYTAAGGEFTGGAQHLRKMTGASRETVIRALRELTERDLIDRRKVTVKDGSATYYTTKSDPRGLSQNDSRGLSQNDSRGLSQNDSRGLSHFEHPTNNQNKSLKYNNIYNAHAHAIENVVKRLNEVSGSQFDPAEYFPACKLLDLLTNGYTEEDLLSVIELKRSEWQNDPKMHRYLRPSTLFGKKFPQYIAEARAGPQIRATPASGTFDTEEFFQAALAKTLSMASKQQGG